MAPHFPPLVAAVALVALGACSSAPTQDPSQAHRVVATSDVGVIRSFDGPTLAAATSKAAPDSLLAALSTAYSDLGIDVKMWDPRTRQVGNKNFSKMYRLAGKPLSEYLGCGTITTGRAADSYRVTMSAVSHVTPNGSGSRVETQLTAYAEDIGSSKGRLSCLTLGTLEERIHELAIRHAGG
jgi:hypothetical protein